MKLTILGYWGGYPTKGIGTSSYLLESAGFHLLIDAGSASLIALEQHLDPLALDALILSHYHHDHIADVGVLQFTRLLKKDANGESAPILPIYGHTENPVRFNDLSLDGVSKGLPYQETNVKEIGPFMIRFLRTIHPVPCFAMRIEEKITGKVLCFTADSGYQAAFVPFAKGADVLMTDTNFFAGMENHPVHMTAKEVGGIAQEAGVPKLILTHLPQVGDLEVLKEQAIEAAPDVEVILAEKDLMIEI